MLYAHLKVPSQGLKKYITNCQVQVVKFEHAQHWMPETMQATYYQCNSRQTESHTSLTNLLYAATFHSPLTQPFLFDKPWQPAISHFFWFTNKLKVRPCTSIINFTLYKLVL